MDKLKILLVVIFLTGCSGAELVCTNIQPAGGVVRYKNGTFVREESRAKALATMQKHCSPKSYKILKEEFNPDVFSIKVGGSQNSGKDNYMFVNFSCE